MYIHLPSFRRKACPGRDPGPESRPVAPLDSGLRRGDDFDGTTNPAPMFEPGVGALFVAFWHRACQGHAVTRSYDKP